MAKKAKAKPKTEPKAPPLNAMEAIAGYCYFLSSRKTPIVFSSNHDFAPNAELMVAFQKENNLPTMRKDFPVTKFPTGVDHLTNIPRDTGMMKAPSESMTVLKAVDIIKNLLWNLSPRDQLALFSQIVELMRREASDKLQQVEDDVKTLENRMQRASKRVHEVERILTGDLKLIV